MYDFIKLNATGDSFNNLKKLNFRYEFAPETGEISKYEIDGIEYSTRGTYKHKYLTIDYYHGRTETIIIKGSLPKYFNEEDQNYTDYTKKDFKYTVQKLEDELNVSKYDLKLLKLEYGVNFNPYENLEILLNNIFLYRKKEFNHLNKDKYRYSKKFTLSQHVIKFYDKGIQYHLQDNLLRYECGVTKIQKLNKKGIYKLSDLNDYNTTLLANSLINELKHVIIYDYKNNIDSSLNSPASMMYWSNLIKPENKIEYTKVRRKYNTETNSNNSSLRNTLISIIKNKLKYLIEN